MKGTYRQLSKFTFIFPSAYDALFGVNERLKVITNNNI